MQEVLHLYEVHLALMPSLAHFNALTHEKCSTQRQRLRLTSDATQTAHILTQSW